MDPFVFFVVLFSAACHAAMNCALKSAPDPLAASIMLAIGGGVAATPVLILDRRAANCGRALSGRVSHSSTFSTGAFWAKPMLPARSAWFSRWPGALRRCSPCSPPCFLFSEVMSAQRTGSPSPAFSAASTSFSPPAMTSTRSAAIRCRSMCWPWLCPVMGYTLVDGYGARASGSPLAYVVFLYVANGWVLLAYGLARQRQRLIAAIDQGWLPGLPSGASLARHLRRRRLGHDQSPDPACRRAARSIGAFRCRARHALAERAVPHWADRGGRGDRSWAGLCKAGVKRPLCRCSAA